MSPESQGPVCLEQREGHVTGNGHCHRLSASGASPPWLFHFLQPLTFSSIQEYQFSDLQICELCWVVWTREITESPVEKSWSDTPWRQDSHSHFLRAVHLVRNEHLLVSGILSASTSITFASDFSLKVCVNRFNPFHINSLAWICFNSKLVSKIAVIGIWIQINTSRFFLGTNSQGFGAKP